MLDESSDKSLIGMFIKPIRLGMVSTADSVLDVGPLKQCFIDKLTAEMTTSGHPWQQKREKRLRQLLFCREGEQLPAILRIVRGSDDVLVSSISFRECRVQPSRSLSVFRHLIQG